MLGKTAVENRRGLQRRLPERQLFGWLLQIEKPEEHHCRLRFKAIQFVERNQRKSQANSDFGLRVLLGVLRQVLFAGGHLSRLRNGLLRVQLQVSGRQGHCLLHSLQLLAEADGHQERPGELPAGGGHDQRLLRRGEHFREGLNGAARKHRYLVQGSLRICHDEAKSGLVLHLSVQLL